MAGDVLSDGDTTPTFEIGNNSTPVNLFFTCVLSHAVQDLEEGVYIRYCLDGSLFDSRRLTSKTRTLHKLIHEAPFSPMSVPSCHTKTVIYSQCSILCPKVSRLFGPTISLNKIEVLHQLAPNSDQITETLSQTVTGSRM